MRRTRRSPATVKSYAATYKAFVASGCSYLNDKSIESFLLEHSRTVSGRAKAMKHFMDFVRWAGPEVYAVLVGRITLRVQDLDEDPPITETSVARFLQALYEIHKSSWAVAVIILNTGMAIGDVMRIGRSQLVFDNGTALLRFRRKGQAERIYQLNAEALVAVQAYTAPLRRRSETFIRSRFVEAEKQAGIGRILPRALSDFGLARMGKSKQAPEPLPRKRIGAIAEALCDGVKPSSHVSKIL